MIFESLRRWALSLTLMILSLDQTSRRGIRMTSDVVVNNCSSAVRDPPFSYFRREACVQHSTLYSPRTPDFSHSTKGTFTENEQLTTHSPPSIFDACCGTLMNHSIIVASRTILAPDKSRRFVMQQFWGSYLIICRMLSKITVLREVVSMMSCLWRLIGWNRPPIALTSQYASNVWSGNFSICPSLLYRSPFWWVVLWRDETISGVASRQRSFFFNHRQLHLKINYWPNLYTRAWFDLSQSTTYQWSRDGQGEKISGKQLEGQIGSDSNQWPPNHLFILSAASFTCFRLVFDCHLLEITPPSTGFASGANSHSNRTL